MSTPPSPARPRGAAVMAKLPAYERYAILRRTADLMAERVEELGRTITMEEGKVIAEGRGEVLRAVQTITLSSEEAKRLHGETVPLDAAPGNTTQFGFTIRVPVGVVAAIAPFNFPLNLVCHKVGPALAAGNAVVLKPAGDTPLSGLKLTEILLEAGLPPEAIQCVTGSGAEIGDAITSDPRVRKITFTGSMEVGDRICRTAGIKKVTMELGSNSPLIVMSDADIEKVAAATVASGFANAGQVCISTQRVLADRSIYADFLDALKAPTEAFATGNPLDESIKMGPMIRESDASRVRQWIDEAVGQGARGCCRRRPGRHHPRPYRRGGCPARYAPFPGRNCSARPSASALSATLTKPSRWLTIPVSAWPPASLPKMSIGPCALLRKFTPATCTSTPIPNGAPT